MNGTWLALATAAPYRWGWYGGSVRRLATQAAHQHHCSDDERTGGDAYRGIEQVFPQPARRKAAGGFGQVVQAVTPQYKGLEDLYEKYAAKGFMILGFPCNQFGSQEPGSNEEIQSFCKLNYDVSFPILAKIDVNGDSASPVFKFLKEQAPGILGTEAIKWNFTKFLIGKDGKVIQRYAPQVNPKEIEKDIEAALL